MAKYQIIGATGCPTGIAHTYMAQEALEQAAKNKEVTIKIETHGQVGIENQLTPQEIKDADVVIIAADKDVQKDRFAGKRVINVSVGRGIKEADQLIEDALAGKASVLKGNKKEEETMEKETTEKESKQKNSIGRDIYNNLMNGVSHMLPFVVAGGILMAISFAVWGVYSADPDSSQYNSTAAMIKGIGDMSMGLMVPVLSAYIAEGIAQRPGLAVGFVGGLIADDGGTGFLGGILSGFLAGYFILALKKLLEKMPKSLDGLKAIFLYPVIGVSVVGVIMWLLSGPMESINQAMMDFLVNFEGSNPLILGIIIGCMSAFDMGGPLNKAAYVTGTFLLAQGNTTFMAGVSAACIAPPLITGFAALFFGKYFDKNDRNAGFVNFILGSTHITEGAIPFAAKDPLRNIPIFMLGSSIAAVLTYMFNVQVPAPHGGFLVLPVVTGKAAWVFSILLGSVIAGLLFGLKQKRMAMKKNTNESEAA
ncbi:PTS fructose transporter subunit IIBC [Tetragenococcus koreensis]|uniref:PTS fructose transporter subunit IIC n=1 Tax=Tetragenococcus koreensis TaxID=290335 RepID=UPI001F402EA3|nr:PTS fructose transporter subunit IIBC [Tetragenococcus koreensis]MCF1585320.1 PTS fructose transporter subunit IIBC [Tetragenococcus koreensis]MCF1614873.1 PTS fructose transporter subunit IIBC [Tetragenococcus koreensis]MCF1618880.1 PTS fructose transporter subunit IIBC [Tetragenococcus koreensis]MCF1624732.1 PTS fructose transporter subunit IIBC [Tetragenococcus koreensis]MCF1629553.1 PTS fructose transporter subunit IIBC [Tetragenococcus koreensis]